MDCINIYAGNWGKWQIAKLKWKIIASKVIKMRNVAFIH